MGNVGELFTIWWLSQHTTLLADCTQEFLEEQVAELESQLGKALRARWRLPPRLNALCEPTRVDELDDYRAMLRAAALLSRELVLEGEEWDADESPAVQHLSALLFDETQQTQIIESARLLIATA